MTGSDLIVAAPWIIFAVALAAVCIRLLRARRVGREPPRRSEPNARGRVVLPRPRPDSAWEPAGQETAGAVVGKIKPASVKVARRLRGMGPWPVPLIGSNECAARAHKLGGPQCP